MLPKSSANVSEVIRVANEIARAHDLEYVGTEHILLAIARVNKGVAAQVLAKHAINGEKLRAEIDRLVEKRKEETWVFGRLPGTPHFRNVVALAIEQCQQLESKELCTEHLLLALLKESGSTGNKALKNLGLTFDQARKDVLEFAKHT
jgi:ATP-dependent Clp protease ATP-binding subunit ClpC